MTCPVSVTDASSTSSPRNDRLLRTLHLQPTDRTPVWFMRQAGRSLPEYRRLKGDRSLLEVCRDPELCAEITLQPVHRLGVDAAILYSDIMVPLVGVGVDLAIVEKVGPVVADPIRTGKDTSRLRPLDPARDVPYVLDGISCCLERLGGELPLIGFAGAPFTLASYLVEGRPTRDFLHTKRLMYSDPGTWEDLMSRLAGIVGTYLRAQVSAGVHALQLFDSWAGALSVADYRRYVQPYSAMVFAAVADLDVPIIHFGTGTSALLEALREAGGTTIGVDWRIPLDVAWKRIGYDRGIQGNLDPMVVQAPWEVIERETRRILDLAGGRPGHIFNLGHGVHPETPVDNLRRLVEFVHASTAH